MHSLERKQDKRYSKEPRSFNKSVSPKINLIGQRFGRLTVIDWAGKWNQKNFWICECECGNPDYYPVITETRCLRSGNTTSCGCRFRKHNMTGSRIYSTWQNMIRRCTDPNNKSYLDYGARGITVCDRWKEFENFYQDMGEPPDPKFTLDRIDNNSPYSPENCRWASREQQARNTRANHFISWDGQTKTVAEWAEDSSLKSLGISASLLSHRLRKGWDVASAMKTPSLPGKMITYQGETLTMMDWSRKLGAKANVVSKRIRQGWSIEKAISVPLSKDDNV